MPDDIADPNQKSDLELIREVCQGSDDSFHMLHDRYRDPIYRFILYRVVRKDIAEDLTQEVFLKLYRKASKYRPSGKFSSWLYQMARNTVLDHFRRSKHLKKDLSLDALKEEHPGMVRKIERNLSDETLEPSQTGVSEEEKELVRWAISRLNPRYQEMIIHCYINELPHREAAQIMGCSVNSLNVKLHLAKKQLLWILKTRR